MKHAVCIGAALASAIAAYAATVRPAATDDALVNPGMGMAP